MLGNTSEKYIRRKKYEEFCQKNYVPIFSKPWWMDATCEENWDVWIFEKGNSVLAAMPYYYENRGSLKYITKAKLTQNNGIIFAYDKNAKLPARAEFEQKVIDAANNFLETLNLDVYEQQYHYSFNNWQPFFWNKYTCQLRYTYVIDTEDMNAVENNFSAKLRSIIRKGEKNSYVTDDIDADTFYCEHEKVFLKQELKCPFDKEFWNRLYTACIEKSSGKILCAKDYEGNINSVAFFVWDEQSVYLLLGGSMPEYAQNDTYSFLLYKGILMANEMNLKFDFEGSMIKRIAKASRQFGGIPMPYYRIRKIYNPEVVRLEAEQYINNISR